MDSNEVGRKEKIKSFKSNNGYLAIENIFMCCGS